MWTEDLATDESRTSPRCSTSCQMCETRSPRSGLEVQIDPRNLIWNIFFLFFLSSPIKVTSSLLSEPPVVCRGTARANSMKRNHHFAPHNNGLQSWLEQVVHSWRADTRTFSALHTRSPFSSVPRWSMPPSDTQQENIYNSGFMFKPSCEVYYGEELREVGLGRASRSPCSCWNVS